MGARVACAQSAHARARSSLSLALALARTPIQSSCNLPLQWSRPEPERRRGSWRCCLWAACARVAALVGSIAAGPVNKLLLGTPTCDTAQRQRQR